jgi:RNA polymerase sigma-70 factor (ECF subfamily)
MDGKELLGQATGLLVTDSLRTAPARAVAADRADVALAAGGDVRAFERLYRMHLPRIHSLVRRMTGDRDADDVTQEVFVRAWRKLDTFRGDSAFGTWLYRLALNAVVERRRTEASRRAGYYEDPDLAANLSVRPPAPHVKIDFEAALVKLPDGAREIFVLHDVEGYKHGEIADLLDISVGTSKAQLHRARMMLRRHLTWRTQGSRPKAQGVGET